MVEGETHTQREARKIVARAQHTLRTAPVPLPWMMVTVSHTQKFCLGFVNFFRKRD